MRLQNLGISTKVAHLAASRALFPKYALWCALEFCAKVLLKFCTLILHKTDFK